MRRATGATVPKSVLDDLRRQAVARLAALRDERAGFDIADHDVLDHARQEVARWKGEADQRLGVPFTNGRSARFGG